MNKHLQTIDKHLYKPCQLLISNLEIDKESAAYDACSFRLNDFYVLSRTSKITPKKVGQFVTFWKRKDSNSPIQPFDSTDNVDFYVINCQKKDLLGQFVFPKSELIAKRILSTDKKEGKRGFRVYPSWEKTVSKQAIKTQEWQLKHFIEIDVKKGIDLERVKVLYQNKKAIH